MNRLEMQALADALDRWGQPTVSGVAHHGELEVCVTGEMHGYTLHINEPVLLVRDVVTV